MEDKIEIGDYGKGSFKYEKKGFKGGLTAMGIIKDMDGKYLLFEDNDGFNYLVKKDKFEFEKEK
jgi:hypothetical protein